MEDESLKRPQNGRRRRARRLLPVVIFAIVAFIALRDRFPMVADWIERAIHPEQWRAHQSCLAAALDSSGVADFSRIVSRGDIDKTRNGFYVSEVVVGEMGNAGKEERFRFSCYVDAAGGVVKTHKDRAAQTTL